MVTLEAQFLIRLCFLCYLLFKSSSVPSVAPEFTPLPVGRHAHRRTCRMITLETQFLIRLCFLCYLLFKSSSVPSVAT
jgi:hypothetical protein